MDGIAKSMKHKRDGRGNVMLEQNVKNEGFFDYIQGDVTKKCRKNDIFYFLGKEQ